jgi:hypothetical protein
MNWDSLTIAGLLIAGLVAGLLYVICVTKGCHRPQR